MTDDRLEPLDEAFERALVIAAHPDDIEYGLAMAVAKWTTSGKNVAYVLATSGEAGLARPPDETRALRREEEIASAAEVGVTDVEFLDHPDGTIEYGLALRADLTAAIRRHQPQAVFTINHRDNWGPGSLNMADHRAVGLATLDATRDAGNPWVFPESGAAWDGVEITGVNASPSPTHAVDVTGYVERGIASLQHHKVYLEHIGQSAEEMAAWLTSSARAAGARLGVDFAVPLEVF